MTRLAPSSLLARLGATLPIIVAPMAGGPSTPGLVTEAASAGATGFLAGGYQSVDGLREHVRLVRASTARFGVNLFAPAPVPVERDAYDAYAQRLRELGARFGIDTLAIPVVEDDDGWTDKVQLLLEEDVPLVSTTFGMPERAIVDAFHARGAMVVQTVTTVEEALAAAALDVDAIVLQSHEAGGHVGTTDPAAAPLVVPLADLVRDVRAAVSAPVWAAGGIARPEQVERVVDAGAEAAVVGTAVLRSPEAGTNATHRAALADPDRVETVVTHAFSGRPARGLRNAFTDAFSPHAPLGYPAIHHLVGPIRRAAAAAGDADATHLWAGTGFRDAREDPVADIIARLVHDA